MCDRNADEDARTFYDRGGWFAVLHVPPHVRGHVVLVRTADDRCPQGLDRETLAGLELAISEVVAVLTRHYADIKNVLVVSLRAKDPHVHLHLIPVWPSEEAAWRAASGHAEGRMFTFLGDLEAIAIERDKREQVRRGCTDSEIRADYVSACKSDRDALALLAGSEGVGSAGRRLR